MQISLNALKSWVDISSLGADAGARVAEVLTRRGLEVESVRRLDAGLEKVVTAKLLERNKHPEADRLSLCKVSLGDATPQLEIVCGAQNMKAGDIVCLAQVGAHLPNGLKIERSKIRGQISNGMLCSEEELKFKDSSEGILILPPETPIGRPLAEVLGLDDTILELSLTPNRGDCMSLRGVAREVAAGLELPLIHGQSFWNGHTAQTGKSELATHCRAQEKAGAFFAVKMEGVRVGPSPEWLAKRLESLGSRSINNVVDATNWVMLELGHPVHAYDAAKVDGTSLEVRLGNVGERLELLDGTKLELRGSELVIADRHRALGLAGVMGGAQSQVADTTESVVLECAQFDPLVVRAAAKMHGLHTDASARFERGVDGQALDEVMGRLVYWISEVAGGRVTATAKAKTPGFEAWKPATVKWRPEEVSEFLGMDVPPSVSERALKSLGFAIQPHAVVVPSWRNDVRRFEDLIEEVARSIGYENIPATLPRGRFLEEPVGATEPMGRFERLESTREILASQGLLETLHFAFVGSAVLNKYGLNPSVRVQNPMSEVGEWLVPSLLPQMLESVQYNAHHRFGSEPMPVRLFQLRPTFNAGAEIKAEGTHETGVVETWNVAMVLAGPAASSPYLAEHRELDFFDLKGLVQAVSDRQGVRGLRFRKPGIDEVPALYHPGQSAEIWVGKQRVGWLGAIHPKLAAEQKMRERCWMAEWNWEAWLGTASVGKPRPFKGWKEQPRMERDFSLEVPLDKVTAEQLIAVALKAGHPVAETARIFDTYRAAGGTSSLTSVAVRVVMSVDGRSIVEQDAEVTSRKILDAWKKELGVGLKGG